MGVATLIFTYGTLKQGFSNHALLQDLISTGDAAFVRAARTPSPSSAGPTASPSSSTSPTLATASPTRSTPSPGWATSRGLKVIFSFHLISHDSTSALFSFSISKLMIYTCTQKQCDIPYTLRLLCFILSIC